jgi:hypothetical protein
MDSTGNNNNMECTDLEKDYECKDVSDIAKCFAKLHTSLSLSGGICKNEKDIQALNVKVVNIETNI